MAQPFSSAPVSDIHTNADEKGGAGLLSGDGEVGRWWGITCSANEVEGVAPAADWSRWEREGRFPLSGDGNGFATNYGEDLALLAGLGLTHVRLTLEWARVEPRPGKVDSTALDHYDDVLIAARRAGLGVLVTLQHGTLPGWFAEDEGGFPDSTARERRWVRHVDRMAERYQDLVAAWVPVDDPIGWAIRGHGLGSRPPGARSPEALLDAAEGALVATLRADELLRSGPAPVLSSFGLPTVFEVGPDSTAEANRWRQLLFHSWVGLIRDGELVLPDRPPRVIENAVGAFDVVGVSHDHPIGIDQRGAIHPYPPDARRSQTGFTPIVDELGELLSELHAELPGRTLMVTGNGIATADDEWREELVKGAVATLDDARADGMPVQGYLHETGIDGWEGPLGFGGNRGLVSRDRTIRDSGLWLAHHLGATPR